VELFIAGLVAGAWLGHSWGYSSAVRDNARASIKASRKRLRTGRW
jgi:hypothetical protein